MNDANTHECTFINHLSFAAWKLNHIIEIQKPGSVQVFLKGKPVPVGLSVDYQRAAAVSKLAYFALAYGHGVLCPDYILSGINTVGDLKAKSRTVMPADIVALFDKIRGMLSEDELELVNFACEGSKRVFPFSLIPSYGEIAE